VSRSPTSFPPSSEPPDAESQRELAMRVLEASLSGEPRERSTLARQLGATSAEIDAAVASLIADGCRFEPDGLGRMVLREAGLGVWNDHLRRCLTGGAGPWHVEVHREVDSTQNVARRRVEAGIAPPLLITAASQTAGRGRFGRRWHATPGDALLFTAAWTTPAGGPAGGLVVAAAVAVAEAVEALSPGARVSLKWPNDVMIDGRKLAGILTERMPRPAGAGQATLIGVGVNVRLDRDRLPAELAALASEVAALQDIAPPPQPLRLLAELAGRLDVTLRQASTDRLWADWRRRCGMLGKRYVFHTDGRRLVAEVIDLDRSGSLLVRDDAGQLRALPVETTSVDSDAP